MPSDILHFDELTMSLRPWYQVVFPREDLRESCPLDASEFTIHLDLARAGLARKWRKSI